MNNETLSITQANKLLSILEEILDYCADKMSEELNTFLTQLSKIWADKTSREFGQLVFKQSQEILNVLGRNYNTMGQTLEDIVRYYKNVGGIDQSFYYIHHYYRSYVDEKTMKEYFSDGNGDDFGFKDIVNGPNQVIEILQTYIDSLRSIAAETKAKLSKITAFGNNAITKELADSGARIIEVVQESVKILSLAAKEHIERVAVAYGKIGKEASENLQAIRRGTSE